MTEAGQTAAEVLVYVKDDCHLCETLLGELGLALEQIERSRRPKVSIRDIEERDDWYALYREYVPVVVVNDEEVCHYFFDPLEFEQALPS